MEKEKIRRCKYCGQESNIKSGLHNWKNLFRRPTVDEWITLFILIMLVLSTYAYKKDMNELNEYYSSGDYCNQQLMLEQQEMLGIEPQPGVFLNLPNFTLEDG